MCIKYLFLDILTLYSTNGNNIGRNNHFLFVIQDLILLNYGAHISYYHMRYSFDQGNKGRPLFH